MPASGRTGGPDFYGDVLDVRQAYIGALVAGAVTYPSLQSAAPVWNITDTVFGAKGDARWVVDAAITTGTPNLTSATAAFTAADVGKVALIAGAGAAGVLLSTTISAYVSATAVTLAVNAATTVSAKNACFATDNTAAIQKAINAQQTNGGTLQVPTGKFGVLGYTSGGQAGMGLVPGPGTLGSFTDATTPLLMQGDGFNNSFLVALQDFQLNGLIGYSIPIGSGAKCAQVVMRDMTLDGNYIGVSGGVLPQTTSNAGALWAPSWPFINPFVPVNPQAPTGQYHVLERIRLYRPAGYTHQPSQGIRMADCVFDQTGQPDVASGGLHWDNIGSAGGDVIATGCSWKDASGNYADFTNTGTGTISRLIMLACVSRNHQIGGVYGLGIGSIIALNRLSNINAGSSVAYDSGGPTANRSKNMVFGNVLDNITTNPAVGAPSFALYGDLVFGNTSGDSGGAFSGGMTLQQGPLDLMQIAGNFNSPAASGAGAVNGDKIIFAPGGGAGQRAGFGYQSAAVVAFLANVAAQKFSVRVDAGGSAQASTGLEVGYFDSNGHIGSYAQMYPGAEAGGTQTLGGFLHATGVPSNANGNNNDWCISDGAKFYFKTGGAWTDLAALLANITFSGHLVSTASGTPATSALGANVTSATFTGNDVRGTIAIVMSGALAANTRVCTATFAVSYGATSPKVTLVDQTSAVGLTIVNSYVLSQSTGVSFDIAFDQALGAGTYTLDYIVIG